jgi:quercetin dioxygenase-like cupin family protein
MVAGYNMAALGKTIADWEAPLRNLLRAAVFLMAGTASAHADQGAEVVLDNARVTVVRANSVLPVADYPAAVVVVLKDDLSHKAGDAYWSGDPAARQGGDGGDLRSIMIVAPKKPAEPAAATTPEAGPKKPGPSPFVGISFQPLFENDQVSVVRGRMEVGAQEAAHTHGADIVLIHLTGGAIEDTADGVTKVNRFKNGDVEFEARGSSHSARNVGPALEAILVTLKP